jgi:hypothetical protein
MCTVSTEAGDAAATILEGARGRAVGWGTMLQAGRSPARVPDEVDFFNLANPYNRTMAL